MPTGFFILTIVYGGASFLVYTLIIRMMLLKWKDYNTTFFKLYIVEYVFNLLTFINSFITLRAPQHTCKNCFLSSFFESQSSPTDSSFPLHIFFTIHYCMAFIQYSMIFLLSLNRLSMMIFVNSYEKCWRRIFPWILIAIVVFPITQTWSIATSNSYYLYVEKLDGYLAKTVADVTGILDVLLTFMGVITILTMSTNILAIIRLYFLADRITEVEKNLFFVSFVAFVIQCIAAGDTFILRFAVTDVNHSTVGAQTAAVLMPFASDLLTLSHPWTLIYFSSKVRLGLINLYYPKWKIKIFHVTISC